MSKFTTTQLALVSAASTRAKVELIDLAPFTGTAAVLAARLQGLQLDYNDAVGFADFNASERSSYGTYAEWIRLRGEMEALSYAMADAAMELNASVVADRTTPPAPVAPASRLARFDVRYVASDDARATMTAWAHDTMDMGGWTDGDEAAFLAAVQDEYEHGTGEALDPADVVFLPAVADEDDMEAAADALVDGGWMASVYTPDTLAGAMAAFHAVEAERAFA